MGTTNFAIKAFASLLSLFSITRITDAQPNMIFYLADDQDIYDYGFNGNDQVNTSAVDRLAEEGMEFTQAFTPQTISAPSRSALYTGKYPVNNGCYMNHISVKPGQKSIAQYLQDLGYEVILAGKSHVGPSSVFQWDRRWKSESHPNKTRAGAPLDSIKAYFQKTDQPFCMFIASKFPHGPYPEVQNPDPDDYVFHPFEENRKNDPDYIKRKAGYYKNIENDNQQLEQILQWTGQYLSENTLFIYSADHGISGKFTLYDRGLHVPFVVRWPKVIEPHSQSDVMINYTDVLPTFIDAAGGELPEDIDGKSFLHVLKGKNRNIHQYVYGVQTKQNIRETAIFPSRMIRSKEYKYIRNFNSLEVAGNNIKDNNYVNAFIMMGAAKFKHIPHEELYHLKKDPYEQNNLADSPKYQKIKAELAEKLNEWLREQDDFILEDQAPLLKPTLHTLDEESRFHSVPDYLINTIPEDEYRKAHY